MGILHLGLGSQHLDVAAMARVTADLRGPTCTLSEVGKADLLVFGELVHQSNAGITCLLPDGQ